MRKSLITFYLFFLFSFSAIIVFGQTVYYCDGCVRNGLCPVSKSFSTCEEAEASARLSCPGGGARVDCSKKEDGPLMNRARYTSPLGNGIMGSMLGALGFSLVRDANGNNQWATGAAGGYFFFSLLTYIAKPKSRPVGVNIIFGAFTGATGGYGGVKLKELIKNQTTPTTTPAKKDNIVVITAVSAAAGAVFVPLFAPKSTKGGYSSLNRKSSIFSKMAFQMKGNGFGIIVSL